MRLWLVSVLADASNERSCPSSTPSIKRLLPLQSFTRGLILYEAKAAACSRASASNTDVPSGAAHISALFLFLAPSSFPSTFHSSFQVFPGVFVFARFLLSSRDRWEQKAWQFSSPLHPLHCFLSPLLLSFFLCGFPNWAERRPWSTILKEGSEM